MATKASPPPISSRPWSARYDACRPTTWTSTSRTLDDPHTDLEETLSTYGELIKKGKVRVIGASNYDARRLLEARQVSARLNLPSYQSLQPEYNLYDRADYETNLEPTVEELGIGVISYYSLASGFLSGKYRNQADTAGRARERR